ncbi:MAG TPA: peptidoglycan DD-metalloendopeptidase family protein [Bacteroidota bacterium]|nr:peptidoglycan DD-metalloendopeptidase family protein [Bacteroidota bacterium]
MQSHWFPEEILRRPVRRPSSPIAHVAIGRWCMGVLVLAIVSVTVCGVLEARGSDNSQSDIRKKERALQKLRSDIENYEKRIRESERKEKVTLERLDDMEHQVGLLQTLLRRLQMETSQLRTDIDTTQGTIQFFEAQLVYLQQHYARYVTSVYKFGRVHDFETLLSSKSLNQLYIRLEYMKYFTQQRKRDVTSIREKKKLLEGQRSALQEKLASEHEMLIEKESEGKSLLAKKEERRRTLNVIRKDKTVYQQELARKTKAAEQLGSLITELIEKDRLRKEHEAQQEREKKARLAQERLAKRKREEQALRDRQEELERLKKTNQASTKIREKEKEIEQEKTKIERQIALDSLPGEPDSKPFSTLKGRLMWPISKGLVVAGFGEQIHPVLKTITQNTGIDIAVANGTSIKSVADGEVALIHWLPSFGNLVIINHNDGYRTVYTHLSDISVNQGQTVKAGDEIAKSGDSVSGSLLHFEIWKDKTKQNPESWLTRRH